MLRKTPKYRLRHPNNESRQQIGALDSLKLIRPQLSARTRSDCGFPSFPITPRALFGHASSVLFSPRAIQIAERRVGTNPSPVSFFPLCHDRVSLHPITRRKLHQNPSPDQDSATEQKVCASQEDCDLLQKVGNLILFCFNIYPRATSSPGLFPVFKGKALGTRLTREDKVSKNKGEIL